MEQLVEVLQGLIEKYNIEQADVALIQEALDAVQSSADEFEYPEEE